MDYERESLIDCSHDRTQILDQLTIELAVREGMKLGDESRRVMQIAAEDMRRNVSDMDYDDMEFMQFLTEEALTFLNDKHNDVYTFYIEDATLWREEV